MRGMSIVSCKRFTSGASNVCPFSSSFCMALAAARSSVAISASGLTSGRRVKVVVEGGALLAGAGMLQFTWKKAYCSAWDAVGLCWGSYYIYICRFKVGKKDERQSKQGKSRENNGLALTFWFWRGRLSCSAFVVATSRCSDPIGIIILTVDLSIKRSIHVSSYLE